MPIEVAKCRCGQRLEFAPDALRVTCPSCGAKIRLRRVSDPNRPPQTVDGEGSGPMIRFRCPCGRRLKLPAESASAQCRCPACERVLVVPDVTPETATKELGPDELKQLEVWANAHRDRRGASTTPVGAGETPVGAGKTATATGPAASAWTESGLRLCPRCGQPLHVAATACRNCGAPTPRR